MTQAEPKNSREEGTRQDFLVGGGGVLQELWLQQNRTSITTSNRPRLQSSDEQKEKIQRVVGSERNSVHILASGIHF